VHEQALREESEAHLAWARDDGKKWQERAEKAEAMNADLAEMYRKAAKYRWQAEQERDAYKKAKAENARLRAELDEARKLPAGMVRELLYLLHQAEIYAGAEPETACFAYADYEALEKAILALAAGPSPEVKAAMERLVANKDIQRNPYTGEPLDYMEKDRLADLDTVRQELRMEE